MSYLSPERTPARVSNGFVVMTRDMLDDRSMAFCLRFEDRKEKFFNETCLGLCCPLETRSYLLTPITLNIEDFLR